MTVILPPVPGIVKLQYFFTVGADASVMTHLYFGSAGGSSYPTSDLQGFVNLARSSYVTNLKSLMCPQVILGKVVATDLHDLSTIQVQASGSDAGTRSLSMGPASVCVIQNMKIARRYRGGHPRVYWPWGNSGDTSAPQQWSSSFVGLCQTGINAYVAALQAYTSTALNAPQLSNVSYYHSGSLRTTPVVDPVLSSVINPIPGTQRRRLRP